MHYRRPLLGAQRPHDLPPSPYDLPPSPYDLPPSPYDLPRSPYDRRPSLGAQRPHARALRHRPPPSGLCAQAASEAPAEAEHAGAGVSDGAGEPRQEPRAGGAGPCPEEPPFAPRPELQAEGASGRSGGGVARAGAWDGRSRSEHGADARGGAGTTALLDGPSPPAKRVEAPAERNWSSTCVPCGVKTVPLR